MALDRGSGPPSGSMGLPDISYAVLLSGCIPCAIDQAVRGSSALRLRVFGPWSLSGGAVDGNATEIVLVPRVTSCVHCVVAG